MKVNLSSPIVPFIVTILMITGMIFIIIGIFRKDYINKTEREQLECPVCQDCKEVNELYQEELDVNEVLMQYNERCDRDRFLMKIYIEKYCEVKENE